MSAQNKKMTRQEEYDYYAKAENQQPQGPPRRRRGRLTEVVPVRFPQDTLDHVRERAEAGDRPGRPRRSRAASIR